MKKLVALFRRDLRGILRDGFLLMIAGNSLVIAAGTRVAVAWVPIAHIEIYVAPFVPVTACSLIGIVFGFGIIEERETGTWLLFRVVPLGRTTLLTYWVTVVGGSSFVMALVSALIYGVAPARPVAFVALTAVTALTAPLVMLLIGMLASNKISGLAVGKMIGASSLLLVGVFVLPAAGQLGLLWYPGYGLYVGLLRAYAGPDLAGALAVDVPDLPDLVFALVPAACSAAAIVALTRRFVPTT